MANRTARSNKRNARYFTDRQAPPDALERIGGRVEIIGDCWVLNGETDKYHEVYVHNTPTAAHRFIYTQVHDVFLPQGVHIHHVCENPGCIRPDHLAALDAGDHARVHAGTAELDDVLIDPETFVDVLPRNARHREG